MEAVIIRRSKPERSQAGILECFSLLRARVHPKQTGNREVVALDPELLRQVHGREDCQPTIGCATCIREIVFVLIGARAVLEFAVEEVVKGLVFGDIGLEEIIDLNAVGVDKRRNVLNGLRGVVNLALLEQNLDQHAISVNCNAT